jgi:hypothetical protein
MDFKQWEDTRQQFLFNISQELRSPLTVHHVIWKFVIKRSSVDADQFNINISDEGIASFGLKYER